MAIEEFRAVGCDLPIYVDVGYRPERPVENLGLDILEQWGFPVPLRLRGMPGHTIIVGDAEIAAMSSDRQTSTPGKEIITGDTVGGDDKPQIPDPKDNEK